MMSPLPDAQVNEALRLRAILQMTKAGLALLAGREPDVPIPHGEAISSLEYLAQIRGTIFTTTEGVPMVSGVATLDVAIYMPVIVRHILPIKQLRLANGTAVSGNFDLGIYDSDAEGLPRTRLVSTGSTTQSGTGDIQLVDISTISLAAGLYYLASAIDNATAQTLRILVAISTAFTSADIIHSLDGVFEEAGAFPLPTTATPVQLTSIRAAPLMYAGRHQF